MKRVVLDLTDAEAAAILRSEGLHAGHGVRVSDALQRANRKLLAAVGADQPTPRPSALCRALARGALTPEEERMLRESMEAEDHRDDVAAPERGGEGN